MSLRSVIMFSEYTCGRDLDLDLQTWQTIFTSAKQFVRRTRPIRHHRNWNVATKNPNSEKNKIAGGVAGNYWRGPSGPCVGTGSGNFLRSLRSRCPLGCPAGKPLGPY